MEIEQGEQKLSDVVEAVIDHDHELHGEVKTYSASDATMSLNLKLNEYRRESRSGFNRLPAFELLRAMNGISLEHLAVLFSGQVEVEKLPGWTGQVTDYENLAVLNTSERLNLMACAIGERIGFLLTNRADALLGAGKDHKAFQDEVTFLLNQYNKIMEGVGAKYQPEREN